MQKRDLCVMSLEKLYHYAVLMRLHRPVGAVLLLWPTLIALWVASHGAPSFHTVLLFVCGVWIMRSAGCVINDLCDRTFDKEVRRTCLRPLVTQKVSVGEARVLFVLLLVGALSIVCWMDRRVMQLAPVGVVLASLYPLMKRYIAYPQLVLGMAYGWAIPMAYAACHRPWDRAGWLLYAANLAWVMAYDTLYAMVDKEDDAKIGIYSTALWFGRYDKWGVACAHGMMLVLLGIWGRQLSLGKGFYIALGVAACLSAYQQWLIRHRERKACFQAFLNNQWVGAALFLGVLLGGVS